MTWITTFWRVRVAQATNTKIKQRLWWYKLQYKMALVWNKILTNLAFGKDHKQNFNIKGIRSATNSKEINRILIIYSRAHFDPEKDNWQKKFAASSAGNIARNIFAALKPNHDIVYADAKDPIKKDLRDIDLIIGIVSKSFLKYSKLNPHAIKILFLVNSHPLFKLRELINESLKLNIVFSLSEYVSPYIFPRLLRHCDKIILIGNDFVLRTYQNYGIPANVISLINSGVNSNRLIPDYKMRKNNHVRFVFPGSHLGVRKGLFRVIEIWEMLNKEISPEKISLVIIGGNYQYEKIIDRFTDKFPNTKYLGWVDSISDKYLHILQSSHIVLHPSLEEGQVGAVLEAMACGCVPVITEQCGIAITNKKEGVIVQHASETDKMTREIIHLIKNKTNMIDISNRARKHVESDFCWDEFQKNIRNICLSNTHD